MDDKIVYVDDDVNNLRSVERIFRNEPFELMTYHSPITAWGDIKEMKPSANLPKLSRMN
jgi:DNA-binding NtrC family response regulator